jgi:hypothetical protein
VTHILNADARETAKWRVQANRAAGALKKQVLPKAEAKLGFVFDDATISVTIAVSVIRELSVKDLADHIYGAVLVATQTGGTA